MPELGREKAGPAKNGERGEPALDLARERKTCHQKEKRWQRNERGRRSISPEGNRGEKSPREGAAKKKKGTEDQQRIRQQKDGTVTRSFNCSDGDNSNTLILYPKKKERFGEKGRVPNRFLKTKRRHRPSDYWFPGVPGSALSQGGPLPKPLKERRLKKKGEAITILQKIARKTLFPLERTRLRERSPRKGGPSCLRCQTAASALGPRPWGSNLDLSLRNSKKVIHPSKGAFC